MSRSTKKSSIETGETSQESGGVGAFARTLGERESMGGTMRSSGRNR